MRSGYFYLPVLIMALCNPLATLAGRIYPVVQFERLNKSLGGTLVFWTIAFLLSCIIFLSSHVFNTKDITWVAIFIATVASITELYSKKGLDNLFIPLGVLLAMYVVEYFFWKTNYTIPKLHSILTGFSTYSIYLDKNLQNYFKW